MRNFKYRCIIWDWNGTLFNDVLESLSAVNEMLYSRAMPEISLETYREYIDVPIVNFYKRAFNTESVDMDSVSVEYNALYAKFAENAGIPESTVVLLKLLKASGIRQIIVSASKTSVIEYYLDKFMIKDLFDIVSGSDNLFAEGKSERLIQIINGQQIKAGDCLMIGDMLYDRDIASAAGLDCVLLNCGHQNLNTLERKEYTVMQSFFELTNFLEENINILPSV